MGKKWNKNMIRAGVVFTISICTCILFGELLKQWKALVVILGKIFSALTPIIIGFIFAFLLNPIMIYIRRGMAYIFSKIWKNKEYNVLYHKTKVPSLIITLLVFIGILAGFLWMVIPRIYDSLKVLVDNMPRYLDNAQAWVEKMFAKNEMLEGRFSEIINYIENNVMTIVEGKIMPNIDTIVLQISSGVMVGVKAVLNFFVGLIVTVYLLGSKDVLLAQGKKIIYCVFSKKTGNKILEGFAYINSVFGGFINGKILDSIIIGIICFIFTSVIDMEYAVLISVIVGCTNIIPFFGPFIGAIPGALLALMDAPIMFVIFIIFILVLQQFDGNILGPLILGDSTGISGIWVLIAILVGGDLFGVPGMILGVPVFACIYAFFAVQLRDGLRAKNLSSKTEDYFRLTGFDTETGEPKYAQKLYGRRPIKNKKKNFFQRIKAKKDAAKDKADDKKEEE
ncbi:MAG: AI-2E family transporter [Clostridium sp.]|nr:AI-2E family transporter [Clostridium sp.]MCM1398436.1 AI-2E family transporter [Clostridium sp.]MCM1458899.1 AI-2E family transporter [Bacteroides sp.]